MPRDPDEQQHIAFLVNGNRLRGVSAFLEHTYGFPEPRLYARLAETVRAQPAYHRVNRVSVDLQVVKRFLSIGWASEINLRLPGMLGIGGFGPVNAGAPVNAYYAAFGLLQAWFAANGMTNLVTDHTATLRTVAGQIRDRGLFPAPWCLIAVGCPMVKREFLNAPPGADCHKKVEVLSRPAPFGHDPGFWGRQATWLATTRENVLLDREKKWKQKAGKKRINPSVRQSYAANLPPTSLFDCLWRMRVRSNYGDVERFMAIYLDEHDHERFNRSLCTTVSATVGLIELLVMRRIGTSEYQEIAADFLARAQVGTMSPMRLRLQAFGLAAPTA